MKKAVFGVLWIVLLLMASPLMAAGSKQAPAAGAGELETVIFVVPRSLECLDDMALWSADYLGYFKEEGIKFQMEQAFGTTDIRMIATGQADFGYPSPNLILSSIQEGLPVKAVCAADAINIFGMAVRADSGIRTWADLKGKTIALGDAAWATIAAPTVSAAGLNPNDIQYIVAGDSRYQMVNEKKIDVLFTWISEYEQLKGQGFDFIYLDGNDILPVLSNPIITSDKLISQKSDLIKRFNRAFAKGLYFVLCNPEAGADIVLNKFPAIQITWEGALGVAQGRNLQAFGTNEATKKEILSAGIGYMAPAKWDAVIQWAQKVGVINSNIPGNQVFSNDYLDFTWNRAAVEADAKAYQCTSRVYKSR
jgi:ABC-type nitrate/sulfonate/bicarbonate transport system substrate-binding protein